MLAARLQEEVCDGYGGSFHPSFLSLPPVIIHMNMYVYHTYVEMLEWFCIHTYLCMNTYIYARLCVSPSHIHIVPYTYIKYSMTPESRVPRYDRRDGGTRVRSPHGVSHGDLRQRLQRPHNSQILMETPLVHPTNKNKSAG